MTDSAEPSGGPLSHIRVVEIAGLAASSYAARLLADFGAEVIKVEPPSGDAQRQEQPLLQCPDGSSTGAWFGYLNYGKKSVALDPSRAADAVQLAELVRGADVVIHDDPATGAAALAAKAVAADQIVTRVAWFGEGPYRGMACTDSVCRALAGATYFTGPIEGPPLALPDFQAGIVGGLAAAIPLLASLWGRARHGDGRIVDVSVHEATVALAEYQAVEGMAGIVPRRRWGLNRYAPTYPLGIYPCKEGWIGVTIVTPAQWRTYCELLGVPELGRHDNWAMGPDRLPKADELEARIVPQFRSKTAREWFDLALEHRLPFAIVPSLADLLQWPELRARQAIVPVEVGGRVLETVGTPLHLTRTPANRGGAVPKVNQPGIAGVHQRNKKSAAEVPASSSTPKSQSLPLQGMMVVDLSMGWAGPTVTRHLADLGADVIKVEACGYPDWWRGTDNRPGVVEERRYEKTLRFQIMNRNKRAITLDLTTPIGAGLLKDLVRKADAVVENYSADVLPKLGLDYAQLSKVNPSIVMMSMNAYGSRGPWRESRAYGSTLEHGSGLPSVAGRPDDPPIKSHLAFGDPVGGLNGAAALLVALLHRQRTGEGQYIDLSQVQCMMPFAAVWTLLQSANGVAPPRTGNRHPAFVPHGIFRCAGEEQWLQVAVVDDTMWRGLCGVLERADLAADPQLAMAAGRRAAEDRIEDAIEAWTRTLSPDAAMQLLQAHGVAAGVVRVPADLFDDPQLKARGYWRFIDREHIGLHPQPAAPYRLGPEALPLRWAAGTLGQYNAQVLPELLGISERELARLEAEGIIGEVAIPPQQRKSRAAAA